MEKRLIETAILMVYVVVLASSVSGEKDTVDETGGADTVAVVESKAIAGTGLPAATEEAEIDEVQWIYEKVKEIDFSVQEYPIDTSVYEDELDREYKEAFYRVITNQIPLDYDEYYGARYFRNTLRGHFTQAEFVEWLRREADYWYMDYDGDGLPELVVEPWGDGVYVFKYDPDEKRADIVSSRYMRWHLLGAGQLYYVNNSSIGRHEYGYSWKDADGNWGTVYMQDCFDTDLSWQLKGYEENQGDIYYISYDTWNTDDYVEAEVPEEMWEELTGDYFAAIEERPEALTFEDIFGDIEGDLEEGTMDFEETLAVYEKFLAGEISGQDVSMYTIWGADTSTKKLNIGETRYAFWDVTGDGVPELHIQTEQAYYILRYRFGVLFVWWVEDISEKEGYEVLSDGTMARWSRTEDKEYYACSGMEEPSGNFTDRIWFFQWEDSDEDGVYSADDTYMAAGFDEPCTMEMWMEKAGEYLYLDEDGRLQLYHTIEWTDIKQIWG